MPYIKKADREAEERLVNLMYENERKARASARRWRIIAIVAVIGFIWGLF